MKEKVGIIGLGLIGGSLAKRLQQSGYEVTAIIKQSKPITKVPFKVVSTEFKALEDCDIIFVCTPLRLIEQTLKEIKPFIKRNAIVTDVGSVKSSICKAAETIFEDKGVFIGGHPMAGTEKSGFENAFAELFENRTWALISQNTTSEAYKILEECIKQTGANIITTQPEQHDAAVALISHLPLLLSIKLQETLLNFPDKDIAELASKLASSGFESMTRLANGNKILNEDLLSLNKNELNKSLEHFLKNLNASPD